MLYFLSLGTNINPKLNAVRMVSELIKAFGAIQLFPFVETEPVEINSGNPFLNSICVLKSDCEQDAVKNITNNIEISLGRDRADPLSCKKDRTADIDIILWSAVPIEFNSLLSNEPYVNSVVLSNPDRRVDLSSCGLPAIDGPTTVDLNTHTGQIVVTDDKFDCFNQALEAAFRS